MPSSERRCPIGGATEVTVEGTVQVGGTIARVGQRLLGGVSWTASSPACRSGWGERRPHGCYADIMVRTQVRLTEAQHRRLRRYAGRLGISLAEAVRRCVDAHLVREATAPSREAGFARRSPSAASTTTQAARPVSP